MSRIRLHARGSRRATAGLATAAIAALLATALSPTADADDGPTRATAVRDAASALDEHARSLGLTAAQGTTVRDVIVDADGTQHVRYDRTFRRLPVEGGDFVVHLAEDGTYRGASRATRDAISLSSVTPTVPAPKAAGLAASALRAVNVGETLKYGAGSAEYGAVAAAWSAVNVG